MSRLFPPDRFVLALGLELIETCLFFGKTIVPMQVKLTRILAFSDETDPERTFYKWGYRFCT